MNRSAYKIPSTSTSLNTKSSFSKSGIGHEVSKADSEAEQVESPRGGGGFSSTSDEYIPSSLRNNFESQMSLLLETNDKLSSQVESMRANRGIHIDDEQFQMWEKKINSLESEIAEKLEENESLREAVKVKQRRIEELEAMLANSNQAKDEAIGLLEKERVLLERERSINKVEELPTERKKDTTESSSQTSHSGAIPPPAPSPPTTNSTATCTEERVLNNAFTQTDAQPRRTSRPTPPAPTDEDVNQMMIMAELDAIRRSLEVSGSTDSAPTAWAETCSHGVVACLSSVKQRATVFRRELDLLRRQVKAMREKQTSERRLSAGKMIRQAIKREEQGVLVKRSAEVEVGPPPVKLLEIGNPGMGGGSPERMSERLSRGSSRFSSSNNNSSNSNFPQLSNSPLAEVLRRQKDGGKGSPSTVVRRPSGQGGKFQSFRRMSNNG